MCTRRLLVLLLAVASPLRASSIEDAAKAFEALYSVYDTAAILESLKVGGNLPKISGPAALSRAKFGDEALVEHLVDPWGTALHIESVPGKGYVVASAGSDRKFDRSKWEPAANTTSTADDIVLRNGKVVRSPEEWALGQAKLTPEQMKREHAQSRHFQTLSHLRTIITALYVYQIDAGTFPVVNMGDIDGLAKHLEPKYLAKMPRTDAWDQKFEIAIESTGKGYYLASAGPDRKPDTADDIVVETGQFTRNETPPAGDRVVRAWAGYQAARQRLENSR